MTCFIMSRCTIPRRRAYSADDDALILSAHDAARLRELAAQLGKSPAAVRSRAVRLGLFKRHRATTPGAAIWELI